MRLVEYCDYPDSKKIMAVAVSGYSYRLNAGLEDDTEFILYTPYSKIAKENKYITTIYNRIESPIVDFSLTMTKAIQKSMWDKVTWEKFACWARTPCDGDYVFHADYDTLCIGSIEDAIPPDSFHFSGRFNRENGESTNGGFYCKTQNFDNDHIADIVLAPAYDDDIYDEVSKTWWYSDEMGVTRYLQTVGYDRLYPLDWRFNMPVMRQKKSKVSVQTNDVRVLHYMGTIKPWDVKSKQRYIKQRQHWHRIKKMMMEDIT